MPQEPPLDHELEREISRMDYEASTQQAADRLKFQHEIGLAAIKSMMLANGGAIIALLTFIGNNSANYDAAALKLAFGFFCAGLLLVLASYIGAYFSQGLLSNYDTSNAWNYQDDMRGRPRQQKVDREGSVGTWALRFSVVCIMMSLGAFGWGAFSALDGLTQVQTEPVGARMSLTLPPTLTDEQMLALEKAGLAKPLAPNP